MGMKTVYIMRAATRYLYNICNKSFGLHVCITLFWSSSTTILCSHHVNNCVQSTDDFPTEYRNVDFRVYAAPHNVRYVNMKKVLKMTNSMGYKNSERENKRSFVILLFCFKM